jgi:hypothetical protein
MRLARYSISAVLFATTWPPFDGCPAEYLVSCTVSSGLSLGFAECRVMPVAVPDTSMLRPVMFPKCVAQLGAPVCV